MSNQTLNKDISDSQSQPLVERLLKIITEQQQLIDQLEAKVGNDLFTYFRSSESKSRDNYLRILRASHQDFVL